MNSPEFRDIELQIREEKLFRIKWGEKRKRPMEKQRYRAKMERPRFNYIPEKIKIAKKYCFARIVTVKVVSLQSLNKKSVAYETRTFKIFRCSLPFNRIG